MRRRWVLGVVVVLAAMSAGGYALASSGSSPRASGGRRGWWSYPPLAGHGTSGATTNVARSPREIGPGPRRLRPGQACPVTRAEPHPRVPAAMRTLLNGDPSGAYGHGRLWVILPPPRDNVSHFDGKLYGKVGWYVGPRGALHGTARRLDGRRARTGRLQTSNPTTAAGRMEASSYLLPTRGCWAVTGEVDGHQLSFVVRTSLDHQRSR